MGTGDDSEDRNENGFERSSKTAHPPNSLSSSLTSSPSSDFRNSQTAVPAPEDVVEITSFNDGSSSVPKAQTSLAEGQSLTVADAEENPDPAAPFEDPPSMHMLPRQRKLAELAAQGMRNIDIAKKLRYTPVTVYRLLKMPKIKAEMERHRQKLYEDGPQKRLKQFTSQALNVIEEVLNDDCNQYKKETKSEMAKWVVEQDIGKATQNVKVEGGLLVGMLDKLDALKNNSQPLESIIDVTPGVDIPLASPKFHGEPPPPDQGNEAAIDAWFTTFTEKKE